MAATGDDGAATVTFAAGWLRALKNASFGEKRQHHLHTHIHREATSVAILWNRTRGLAYHASTNVA
jgi:hypothetical protein